MLSGRRAPAVPPSFGDRRCFSALLSVTLAGAEGTRAVGRRTSGCFMSPILLGRPYLREERSGLAPGRSGERKEVPCAEIVRIPQPTRPNNSQCSFLTVYEMSGTCWLPLAHVAACEELRIRRSQV